MTQKLLNRWTVCAVLAIAMVALGASKACADLKIEKDEDAAIEEQSVTGSMMGVTGYGINIEYSNVGTTAHDMMIPLDEKTHFVGVQKAKELKPGDVVRVEYQRKYKTDEKGKKVNLATVATRITFVRHAPVEDALQSTEGK